MRAIDSKGKITIMGVTFDGVDDIIRHAVGGKPKGGVYVGEDSQGYPCFDFDDYATKTDVTGTSCLPPASRRCGNASLS